LTPTFLAHRGVTPASLETEEVLREKEVAHDRLMTKRAERAGITMADNSSSHSLGVGVGGGGCNAVNR
jgi:hypothetical protein